MSAYSDLILAKASLSVCYRMGEASGTTLTDAGPNALDGTLAATGITYGVASGLANDANTALTFDGTSDPGTRTDNNVLDLGDGPFWIAFWFKRSATQGTNQTIVTKGTGTYQVRFVAANQLQLLANGGNTIARTSAAITDQNWHFAVVQKNGATTTIYIDGVADTVAQVGATLTDTTTSLLIGRSGAAVQRYVGSLDELAIGKGAVLSADEVLQLYRTGVGAISLAESVGSSDATGADVVATRTESVTVADSVDTTLGGQQGGGVPTRFLFGDKPARARSRTFTDEVAASDAIEFAQDHGLALADEVRVTDSARRGIERWLADHIAVADWTGRATAAHLQLQDQVFASDEMGATREVPTVRPSPPRRTEAEEEELLLLLT